MSKGLSVSYFKNLLQEETSKLTALCEKWQPVLDEQPTSESTLSEDDAGQIRSAIGLAHLLMNQRFKQFSSLINDCESDTTPKVTLDDLQGFWEMVEFQVKDVHSKFEKMNVIPLA